MTRNLLRFPTHWVLCTALAFAMAGCSGPKLLQVKGRIVSGGQPLKMGPQGVLQVILSPEDESNIETFRTYPANVDKEQGTFVVPEGVPPGRYKVVVLWLDPYPMNDKLQGKFTAEKTPIVREITSDADLLIDVADPKG